MPRNPLTPGHFPDTRPPPSTAVLPPLPSRERAGERGRQSHPLPLQSPPPHSAPARFRFAAAFYREASELCRTPQRSGRLRQFALTVLATVLSTQALAHEYWIEKEGPRFVLHQGHRSAAHGGAATVAFDSAIVAQTVCVEKGGKTLSLQASGLPVGVAADCAQISFRLASGYWTKTPYDTINKPRNEVKGALQSWLSEETVTRIEHWSPALNKSALPGLSLLLVANPASLKPGDKFSLLALIDGKPAADVAVAYDGETRGATDADGRINLRVRHEGLQQISASLETPLKDGKADTRIRGATLNFVLP